MLCRDVLFVFARGGRVVPELDAQSGTAGLRLRRPVALNDATLVIDNSVMNMACPRRLVSSKSFAVLTVAARQLGAHIV
jgi:hypothetical protein